MNGQELENDSQGSSVQRGWHRQAALCVCDGAIEYEGKTALTRLSSNFPAKLRTGSQQTESMNSSKG